jgi:hypothetical protein
LEVEVGAMSGIIRNMTDAESRKWWEDLDRHVAAWERRERLIAAAPELLVFACDIRDNWDCDVDAHEHGTPCRCCAAEALIRRIEGEP